MKYLLDTCVISEIIRRRPSTKVTKWIKQEDESNFFISVLPIGEIHIGIEKLDESRRKEELHNWVDNDLKERFLKRIIDIDQQTAMTWGKIPVTAAVYPDRWQTIIGRLKLLEK